jgi:hypothetical protein
LPIVDKGFKRLTIENVNRAPRKRGVYALYEEKMLVFLGVAEGRADTLRSRLRAHLAANEGGGALRYKREPTAAPAARLKSLLGEYRKKNGRLPERNAKPA